MNLNVVKTDKCCFISDCNATNGYDYNYHKTGLEKIFFDGENPEKTFFPNWFKINEYPSKIQKLVTPESINKRYEIKNNNLVSEVMPSVIIYENRDNYDEDIFELYSYNCDRQDPVLEDVECSIEIVMEVENFELPAKMNYKAIGRSGFDNKEFSITNSNVNHQLFDRMIFPEVMLHTRPCSISSHDLYCLVRQHIKENIDTKAARITADYDFCFTVKKLIPLTEPETVSYSNIFARTKKERNKINYVTKTYKEVEIFEMTHQKNGYQNYTILKPIFADNEQELKNKIDEFLSHLIELINKPLKMCDCCKGTGYIE